MFGMEIRKSGVNFEDYVENFGSEKHLKLCSAPDPVLDAVNVLHGKCVYIEQPVLCT